MLASWQWPELERRLWLGSWQLAGPARPSTPGAVWETWTPVMCLFSQDLVEEAEAAAKAALDSDMDDD